MQIQRVKTIFLLDDEKINLKHIDSNHILRKKLAASVFYTIN